MTKEELELAVKNKVNLHGADLREADLHGANLHGADLREADLDFITFQADGRHSAYFWNGIIKIGCQSLSPQEWINKTDEMAGSHCYNDKQKQKYLMFFEMCLKIQKEQEAAITALSPEQLATIEQDVEEFRAKKIAELHKKT